MKIVILDRDTTTADGLDICFSGFENLGEVVIYNNLTEPGGVVAATKGAEVIVVNKVVLDAELIAQLDSAVQLIAITATGFDNVDINAAAQRNIKVCNVPGYGTQAVSQLVFLLILMCTTRIIDQIDFIRNHGWNKTAGLAIRMHELAGKTLGIIGLGEIGLAVAKLGLAFGMKVIAYNRTPKRQPMITEVSLRDLALQADFISLNCALNKDTHNLVNSDFLELMKPGAFLINTARGGLVNENDLISALRRKRIAGAALDVLVEEPPRPDNPLLSMDNVILTPHIGWAPIEARQRCIDITAWNIAEFFAGKASNLLN